jgi:hypothetical protein
MCLEISHLGEQGRPVEEASKFVDSLTYYIVESGLRKRR